MAGNVLETEYNMIPDNLGCEIGRFWITWNNLRGQKMADYLEVKKYLYATDTTKTTNSKNPWNNKTTLPKMCQIRDNLHSNYLASIFPKTMKQNIRWIGDTKNDNSMDKAESIRGAMGYVVDEKTYKQEISKLLYDYIDYGNAFATMEWADRRVQLEDGTMQTGYVGPVLVRIAPDDIVFNPIASSFDRTPKIVRSVVSLGEVKEILESLSSPGNKEDYEALWKYLCGLRRTQQGTAGDQKMKDELYQIDGFGSWQNYLGSNYCEILTFYGDLYDRDSDEFLKNHIIMVVDRHKVIAKRPNPSLLGKPPIWHIGWRTRQDNLWAMGPLDNLVGLQYRIDHTENKKADILDLIVAPILKIKGYVEDFDLSPFSRIYTGDDGDVTPLVFPFQVLQSNGEIQFYMNTMEEMAGSPKEAMGFRTPGEKTKYEVQRLENAGSRIFANKTGQFEEFMEDHLNGMLELFRRKMDSEITVRFMDDDKLTTFLTLNKEDLTGQGRVRPSAARHFAEQADMIQNLTAFYSSAIGADQAVQSHFSSIKLAKLFEDLLDIHDYKIVMPFVRLAEQADAQRIGNAQAEQVMMEALTAAGLSGDDYTLGPQDMQPQGQPPGPQGPPGQPPMGPPQGGASAPIGAPQGQPQGAPVGPAG